MENTNTHPALARLSNASHELLMARSYVFLEEGNHEKRMALMARLTRLQDEVDAIIEKVGKL